MIKQIKHHAVNWVDGMKISQKHFENQENFLIDTIRDGHSFRLNSFNYGLLPNTADDFHSKGVFEIMSTATDDAQLIITNCNALTSAGYRIALPHYKTSIRSLATDFIREDNEDYYIMIYAKPFEKIPFGDIDPEEIPPRKPHALPKYQVDLVKVSNVDTAHTEGDYLIIGKVTINKSSVKADYSFIPPCTSIQSYAALKKYHKLFGSMMGRLRQYAIKILQKTTSAQQNVVFTHNVKALCMSLMNHISDTYFQYQHILSEYPPIHTIAAFSKLALSLHNAMRFMPAKELEELLNYLQEWTKIAPSSLMKQLATVTEINYDHNHCGEYFSQIQDLLVDLEMVLLQLSELDYIGQRRESIVVNERDLTAAQKRTFV